MDTETFLVKRNRLQVNLDDRRRVLLYRHHQAATALAPLKLPFWVEFGAAAVFPQFFGGFWPKTILSAVPFLLSIFRRPEPFFIPLVKSLLNRYNSR